MLVLYCCLTAAVSGFETKNMYKIKNAMGQTMYSVLEGESCGLFNLQFVFPLPILYFHHFG